MNSTHSSRFCRRPSRFLTFEGDPRFSLCLAFILFAVLHFIPTATQAANFTAALDRSTTYPGEPVSLILTFEGMTPTTPPALPAPQGLSIVFAGQSQQVNIVNGRTTASVVLEYSVTASQPGDYVVPPITVSIGGRTVESKALPLKVLKSNEPSSSNDPLRKYGFLKLEVPKKEIYLGEVIPVEIRLYVQDAEEVQMPQLKGEGFTLGKMAKPTQSRTRVGNQLYNLVIFKTTAVAVKTGDLHLGQFELPLVLRIPLSSRRQRDPNDPFGSDLFEGILGTRVEKRRTTLATEPEPIKVMPLPDAGKPADFAGAVGNYSFSASASPTTLTVGDPVTLKIQISGRGALDQLALPARDVGEWKQFKSYTPTSKIETTDDLGLEGVRHFEQVLIPENAGIRRIPDLSFSFFDPELRQYRTITHPPIPLSVSASTQAAAEPTVVVPSSENSASPAKQLDIVHIKPHPGVLAAMSTPWAMRPGFWLLQMLPLALWLSSFAWRRRMDAIRSNPRLRRRIEVDRKIATDLAGLRRFAAGANGAEFFLTAFRLLQERLGERLDLPATSITESVINDHLLPKGLGSDHCRELQSILQLCDQARYAPVGGVAELEKVSKRVETLLEALRKWEPSGS